MTSDICINTNKMYSIEIIYVSTNKNVHLLTTTTITTAKRGGRRMTMTIIVVVDEVFIVKYQQNAQLTK